MKPTLDEQEQSQEDPSNIQENILFKNIDANVDKYSIELEKQIQKLPNPLRFIKKYVHFYFLPRLENILDELETIRQTPNYDEKIVQIKPMTTRSLSSEIISCIDLLNNNNISHSKISKMIFGTMKGNLGIYDIDTDKIVIEMNLSKQNRVDHISTSTIKYFDTYQTRIAASCRGETKIYILSYNHSFTGINTECILNTITPESTSPPEPPEKINLMNIISGLKLSKDGYFLSVTDHAGGVRIFNFADIGIQSQMGGAGQIGTNPAVTGSNEEDANKNLGNVPVQDTDKNPKDKKSNLVISNVPQISGDQSLKFTFVGRFICNKIENFTILPNEAQQVDEKNKKENAKEPAKETKKKDNKKGGKGNEEQEPEVKNPDEYNIKSEFDEEKGDNSMYQTFAENHPWVHFVQKKFIFEDNSNSEYSTSTITVGLYIAFSNSTCFKFISLNEYITDKMKSIFKVKKVKNNYSMSIEDSMNLNSQMHKKEKDFLQFIRQKLDPKKAVPQPENSEVDQNTNAQGNKTATDKDKDRKAIKDIKAKVDPKNANKVENVPQGGTKKSLSDINNANTLLTKKEMNFTTCFNITIMNGQKVINKYNNLLGIGMIDGSILVWDCELHTDKFLFQKNSRFEITSISIDENYLICGTIKGEIYIYDLIEGKELFTCAHDPYSVSSFQTFISFFSFMNIGFDYNNRICIYNSKESHKIGKLILNNDLNEKEPYRICFYNKYLCDYNTKYIVFVCEKKTVEEKNKEIPKNILDLINFSKERIEILRNKPNNKITDFFNLKAMGLNEQLVKVEEHEEENNSNASPENKAENAPTTTNTKIHVKDDKKGKNQKNNEQPPQEEEKVIKPITRLDLRDNVVVIYRVLDVLFKCYPNLVYSHKKGLSLKKIMKKYRSEDYPTYSAADEKKEGLMSIKYLTSDLAKKPPEEGSDLKKELTGVKTAQDEEENKPKDKNKSKNDNSTQRKDIFFNSFKNIKERHQYREERINKLQQQKKKIVKELKGQNSNKVKKNK